MLKALGTGYLRVGAVSSLLLLSIIYFALGLWVP